MDEQNKTPAIQPQSSTPTPQTPQPTPPPPINHKPLKVLQPSAEMMKEVAADPERFYGKKEVIPPPKQDPSPAAVPTNPTSPVTSAIPQASTPSPVVPSNVYPEINESGPLTNNTLSEYKNDSAEPITFKNGMSIGGSIFWLQMVAGLVFGVIFFLISLSVLKSANFTLIGIVSLLYYLIELFVIFYIPFTTLRSKKVDNPLPIALFGLSIQTIIGFILIEIVDFIVLKLILHRVITSLPTIGGSGLGVTIIIVYIGLFIAAYFLTKLSYGLAFLAASKIKDKNMLKIAGFVVVGLLVCGIAYHYLTLRRADNNLIHQIQENPTG